MTATPSIDLVRRYFAAYENSDRAEIERLLADDFRFTSPYDDRIDRAYYLRRCWPTSEHVRRYRFDKLVADGDDVLVVYELELDDGSRLRNAELLRIADGRVREVEVYFGAFGQPEAFADRARPESGPEQVASSSGGMVSALQS